MKTILFTNVLSYIALFIIITSCNNPERAYEKASKVNTVKAFENFLSDFPNSEFDSITIIKIHELKVNHAWDSAISENINLIQSLEFFIRQYPNSKFSNLAIEKIWQRTKKINTIEAYKAFFKKYSDFKIKLENKKNLENLIEIYNSGLVLYYEDKRYKSAYKNIQIVADSGFADAQNMMGTLYSTGKGIKQNIRKAMVWYRLAAFQNYALAQWNLGNTYHYNSEFKNLNESLGWYKKAANQGFAEAEYSLGLMYLTGDGITESHQKAIKLINSAAIKGVVEAQYNLGVMYAEGFAVSQNFTEAFKWFELAAEQGLATAQYNLGVCYANGEGVEKDVKLAKKWYQLAAVQGFDYAIEELRKY